MFKIFIISCVTFVICQGKFLDRQVSCSTIPRNAFECIDSPVIIDRNIASKCREDMNTENQCEFTKCLFRPAGWMEGNAKDDTEKVNKKKISEHFDQFAKDHSVWTSAVQALKTNCLGQDVLTQGVYLNCPAYDVMHCILSSFLKNAGSQWSQSTDCKRTKAQIDACPVCPNECFAPAIPIGSCNACYAQPPSKAS